WTTAKAGLKSSGTSLNLQTFAITPATAKYVRIVGHGNSVNTWNSYTEVRIQTQSAAAKMVTKTTLTSYPNPFHESNTITFYLERDGYTHLAVFDMTGKQVAVLVNGNALSGNHTITFSYHQLPAGMYTLKLTHNGKVVTKTVVKE